MAKSSVAGFQYTIVGDGISDTFQPATGITFRNDNAAAPTAFALQVGANTINVPAGVTWGVYVVPSPNSTNGKTLKGVTGDTGIAMNPGGMHFQSLASTATSFVITSVGVETIMLFWD